MKKKIPPPRQRAGDMNLNEDLLVAATNAVEAANDKSPVKKTGKTNGKTNGKQEKVPVTPDEIDVRELLKVLSEVKHGNFAVRMPIDRVGIHGKICDTLNDIISLNETLVDEL